MLSIGLESEKCMARRASCRSGHTLPRLAPTFTHSGAGTLGACPPLARHGGHSYGRELLRSPLILSTIAGLIANLAGLKFPEAVATTLQRIGLAALPLGLMATGAGLHFGKLKAAPGLAVAFMAVRHAVLPTVAIGLTPCWRCRPSNV